MESIVGDQMSVASCQMPVIPWHLSIDSYVPHSVSLLLSAIYYLLSSNYLGRMTNEKVVAEKLLQVNAVKLNPEQPFTWASGWKSPIYCDNRKVLSFPFTRDFIKSEMCNIIFEKFPDAELLAGVATAGIAWGAMAADQLKLPYVYVRPKPKEHGLGNQIEGFYERGKKVVVIEDLVSPVSFLINIT